MPIEASEKSQERLNSEIDKIFSQEGGAVGKRRKISASTLREIEESCQDK